jgi:dTDP-4-dehydrorhamnose reductase
LLNKEEEYLNIVSDQIDSPTSANYIVDATAYCLQNLSEEGYGTYNIKNYGKTGWRGVAIFVMSQLAKCDIKLRTTVKNISQF